MVNFFDCRQPIPEINSTVVCYSYNRHSIIWEYISSVWGGVDSSYREDIFIVRYNINILVNYD